MEKKEYIYPEITVIEAEFESALLDLSQERPGQAGGNPDNQEPGHELEGKEDNNSSNIWGNDEW